MGVTATWLGTAPAVAEVDTFTPAVVAVGNTFTLTCNSKTITYTAAVNTAADVVTGLLALLALTTIPEFLEVTWSGTTTLIGTASTPGKPFTITSSAAVGTGGGAPTFVRTATTASSGPNHWDAALNWSSGTVPASTDMINLDGAVNILYGLAQSGVTLGTLNASAAFSAQCGLPRWTGSYYEYRPRYLNIKATVVNIGAGDGAGSPRFMLDTDNAQTTLSVFKTASSAEPGLPAMLWKGTHASNAVRVTRGTFGAAFHPGEVATISDLKIDFVNNKQSDAYVFTGSGVTLATISKSGGILNTNGSFTSISQTDGTANHWGSTVNITTITNDGGTVNYNSDGTITTYIGCGAVDFDGSLLAATVTNCTILKGADLSDARSRVTWTNGVILSHCRIKDVTLDLGSNFKLNGVTAL